LLGSDQMREMLETWRGGYDHVVIDSPPVLSVTDSVLLAASVDRVIMVVRSGRTTKAALQRSKDLLINVNASIMGVVVNAVNLNSPDYYYYYYSGSKYGGYYSQGPDEESVPSVSPGEAS